MEVSALSSSFFRGISYETTFFRLMVKKMDALNLIKQERKRLQQKLKASSEHHEEPVTTLPIMGELKLPSCTVSRELPAGDERVRACIKVIPDFVSAADESVILKYCYAPHAKWQEVRDRRLQCFGGDPVAGAVREQLPEWLQKVARLVETAEDLVDFSIDHVLLNEYHVGDGIMAHTDGPSYHPMVACLCLGDAHADMVFSPKLTTEQIGQSHSAQDLLCVTLMPRDLILFWGFAYQDALHRIENVRGGTCRVSLTMRKILI